MQEVCLRELLDESIEQASDRITLAHVNVTRNYPTTPCYVKADRVKIKLAFLNIIINAIEAMSNSDGELIISITDLSSQYVIEISDNGSGIPENNLPKLFEPYFTSKLNGTGLGLATTFNILQAHKASIDVASKQGSGTTFSITIDRA
jgi:signal transduction histidine kinase